MSLTTPVALFVFNRPELTRLAVERLAAIRPSRLLVIADGPRTEAEAERCRETRQAVRDGLTWDVEAEFLESPANLGCRRRIESGLDWVFERVDRAILLEDDIEVSPAFLGMASASLERFAGRADVRMICAHNTLIESPGSGAAFLSRTGSIWGWATWADRWQTYRREFPRLSEPDALAGIARHAAFEVHARLQSHLLRTRLWETIDTWDMPWSLWNLASGGLCLTASHNQAINHGVGRDATHTTADDDIRARLPIRPWSPGTDVATSPVLDDAYDRAFTLLEIVLNYDEPRRWKVLAKRRGHLPPAVSGPGWDIMLSPFDHYEETAALIAHLRRHVAGAQLDQLAEVFRPSVDGESAS